MKTFILLFIFSLIGCNTVFRVPVPPEQIPDDIFPPPPDELPPYDPILDDSLVQNPSEGGLIPPPIDLSPNTPPSNAKVIASPLIDFFRRLESPLYDEELKISMDGRVVFKEYIDNSQTFTHITDPVLLASLTLFEKHINYQILLAQQGKIDSNKFLDIEPWPDVPPSGSPYPVKTKEMFINIGEQNLTYHYIKEKLSSTSPPIFIFESSQLDAPKTIHFTADALLNYKIEIVDTKTEIEIRFVIPPPP